MSLSVRSKEAVAAGIMTHSLQESMELYKSYAGARHFSVATMYQLLTRTEDWTGCGRFATHAVSILFQTSHVSAIWRIVSHAASLRIAPAIQEPVGSLMRK
jgi:hypothetical protein